MGPNEVSPRQTSLGGRWTPQRNLPEPILAAVVMTMDWEATSKRARREYCWERMLVCGPENSRGLLGNGTSNGNSRSPKPPRQKSATTVITDNAALVRALL